MLEDNFDFLIESLDKDEKDVKPQYVSNGLYTSDYTVPVVKQMKNYNC